MFRHLLTQVRLVCYSDHADGWGIIKTIEAVDVHTRQTLDLEQETPRLDDISSDDGIKNIPIQDIVNLSIPDVTSSEDLPGNRKDISCFRFLRWTEQRNIQAAPSDNNDERRQGNRT